MDADTKRLTRSQPFTCWVRLPKRKASSSIVVHLRFSFSLLSFQLVLTSWNTGEEEHWVVNKPKARIKGRSRSRYRLSIRRGAPRYKRAAKCLSAFMAGTGCSPKFVR